MGVLKTLNINTWAGQDIQACLNGVRFPAEEDKKIERRGRGFWGGARGNQKPYLIWDFLPVTICLRVYDPPFTFLFSLTQIQLRT